MLLRGGSRSKVAVVLFLAFCCVISLYNVQLLIDDDDSHDDVQMGLRRQLSKSLPDGGCEITWPQKPPSDIEITYAASYPGCGARMTWNLVEALTGLETGDDWNNNGRGSEVVTVKTHYPQSNGILVEFDDQIQRVFIVIRNPMKSIPSFFNHIYEMRNHLPVHSERAPLEEWTKWRDAYLDIEIAEYKKFINYWMDRYTPENRLLLTYEGLTDELIGPEVTKGLNEFLGKARGVTPIHPDSVACIWRAVVKNKPPEHQKKQFEKLQSQALNQPQGSIPIPSAIQPKHGAAIQSAADQSRQQQQLPPKPERQLVEQEQRITHPQGTNGIGRNPSNALSAKELYLRNSAIPLQQHETPQVHLMNIPNRAPTIVGTVPKNEAVSNVGGEVVDPLDVLNEEMKKILVGGQELLIRTRLDKPFQQQSPVLGQPGDLLLQHQASVADISGPKNNLVSKKELRREKEDVDINTQQLEMPKPQDMLLDQQAPKKVSDSKKELQSNEAVEINAQQLEQSKQEDLIFRGDHDDNGVDPLVVLQEKLQRVLKRGKKLLARHPSPPTQKLQDEMISGYYGRSHRRLDPGHHNSQRVGPDVPRPYLPRQLDSMMQMLLEVANRYEKKDVRLYHVMMGYYEQIRSERAKMQSDEPMNVKSPFGFY